MWTLRDKIVAGTRPSIEGTILDKAEYSAVNLMQRCWSGNVIERPPSFRRVCEVLAALLPELDDKDERGECLPATVATPAQQPDQLDSGISIDRLTMEMGLVYPADTVSDMANPLHAETSKQLGVAASKLKPPRNIGTDQTRQQVVL
jgi:hypothetical protein